MVDVLSSYLQSNHFKVESLHGDMKQSQRNSVMNLFKQGNLEILIATDVAARGIDVNDIDYVINYDIPQNVEYYVHRIGRTGRAGKSGMAITICSGRSQVEMLTRIGRFVKSRIKEEKLPKADDIRKNRYLNNINEIEDKLKSTSDDSDYKTMLSDLLSKGYDLSRIATAALESYFEQKDKNLKNIKLLEVKPTATYLEKDVYQKIVIDVGRAHHVEPNHIVGAITGQSGITGKEIGKIEIFDKKATIAVPRTKAQQIVRQMKNCKICGYPITTVLYQIKSTHISKNEHLHRNIRKHYK
jgi:ATP-dependent RNA helicase DeaD